MGKTGENLAENFLKSLDYEIISSNYQTKIGEIDIVAKERSEIVFVEVKTRTSLKYGFPQESITKSKLNRLRKLAFLYLAENKIKNTSFRIDVISIQLEKTGKVLELDHIKNI